MNAENAELAKSRSDWTVILTRIWAESTQSWSTHAVSTNTVTNSLQGVNKTGNVWAYFINDFLTLIK